MQEFFQKDCWKHHPLPYSDFVQVKKEERKEIEKARQFVIRDWTSFWAICFVKLIHLNQIQFDQQIVV